MTEAQIVAGSYVGDDAVKLVNRYIMVDISLLEHLL